MKQKEEDNFIKGLEFFLDTEFNDFSKKRILSMLEEYKNNIPVREKEVIKYQEVKVYRRISDIVPVTVFKTAGTPEKLLEDAKVFCELHKIDLKEFIKTKYSRKARHEISSLRKEFCRKAFEKYITSNNMLAKFFSINHTTVTFYLYGSKYVRKTDRKMNMNTDKRKLYINTTSQA
jgi:hypothetical protein